MELQGDVGLVESCFGPFGDRGSVGARYVHGLNQMYHRVRNHFGRTRWNFQGDMGNVESLFGSFGDSVGIGAR